MNLPFSLYRLQTIDTQRQKITRRLTQIEAILNADEFVKAKLQQKQLAAEELAGKQSQTNKIAAETSEKRLKLELNQVQLFGGKVRNPKELQDLQAESEALKRTIQKLEDAHFQALMEQEDAQKKLAEAEQAHQSAVNAKATENSLLAGERGAVTKGSITLRGVRIVAQRQQHLRRRAAGARAGHGLVGALAAGDELKTLGDDILALFRKALCLDGEVQVDVAQDGQTWGHTESSLPCSRSGW